MHRIEMGITRKMRRADTVAMIAEVDVDKQHRPCADLPSFPE